jgi:hypothetical protein
MRFGVPSQGRRGSCFVGNSPRILGARSTAAREQLPQPVVWIGIEAQFGKTHLYRSLFADGAGNPRFLQIGVRKRIFICKKLQDRRSLSLRRIYVVVRIMLGAAPFAVVRQEELR